MVITCINTTTFQHCNGVLLNLYPDFEFRHLCQSLLYNYNCTEQALAAAADYLCSTVCAHNSSGSPHNALHSSGSKLR